MIQLPKNKKIILFDGVCNLCNKSVLKVIRHDKKNDFVFCALQSETGAKIIQELQVDILKMDTIILYENPNSYYFKSTAVLKIMNSFGGLWCLTQIFRVFPEVFINVIYDFIAKNRYRWFGQKESCMLPTTELNEKFLS
jgi:predicted DCC family thiol-disulfide oxidoreductase YuxK